MSFGFTSLQEVSWRMSVWNIYVTFLSGWRREARDFADDTSVRSDGGSIRGGLRGRGKGRGRGRGRGRGTVFTLNCSNVLYLPYILLVCSFQGFFISCSKVFVFDREWESFLPYSLLKISLLAAFAFKKSYNAHHIFGSCFSLFFSLVVVFHTILLCCACRPLWILSELQGLTVVWQLCSGPLRLRHQHGLLLWWRKQGSDVHCGWKASERIHQTANVSIWCWVVFLTFPLNSFQHCTMEFFRFGTINHLK